MPKPNKEQNQTSALDTNHLSTGSKSSKQAKHYSKPLLTAMIMIRLHVLVDMAPKKDFTCAYMRNT